MRTFLACAILLASAACDETPENQAEFNEELREVLHQKPVGSARAYALVKSGAAGPDWLATIHGYADNRSVCEELIEPYNSDPDLSVLSGTYSCEEI